MEEAPILIHLYSGPRSLSTSLMYSFAQRNDTQVIDEPLYASWLSKNPSVYRPYREELLKVHNSNADELLQELNNRNQGKPVIFLKQIAKQLIGIDRSLLYHKRAKHVFLIRDPFEMITSWSKKNDVHQEGCTLDSMCLPLLADLYSDLRCNAVNKPIVIDSDLLKSHPREILTALCQDVGIDFQKEQLSWPAGPKPDIDG
jgi:hypothetical protein